MATSLRQLQTQKQKLAPRQVLQARLLQLNTVNLEQAILSELEQNPLLEQVEPEELHEEIKEETAVDDIDVSLEDMYSDESTYYFSEENIDISKIEISIDGVNVTELANKHATYLTIIPKSMKPFINAQSIIVFSVS